MIQFNHTNKQTWLLHLPKIDFFLMLKTNKQAHPRLEKNNIKHNFP